MSFEISRTHDLIKDALDYRAMRQDMIASNIANADTPFYRPRDVHFEELLSAKKAEALSIKSPKLQMANTSTGHLKAYNDQNGNKATTFYRDGHQARNDGNSVDLDVETTEMSKNSTMFNALINANKKSARIFKSVLEASGKVS
ncbi:MAG: flagellar basal body rod protein FlgB [Sulfurimonadaceae bacterium]|jgi:flagellar basal-body rod protein FlgB|nr:flagellar basal body rod protein FlgB [Sulfurimonadaceae bacterium]